MRAFSLEDLKNIIKSFSATQCDFLSENCIVALENHNLKSGCKLSVKGEKEDEYELIWSKVFSKKGYKADKKIIEKAAEAISFFLSYELTNFTDIEEAKMDGGGFDYWLTFDEGHELDNPLNFMRARLEISGINEEAYNNTLRKRAEAKMLQVQKSDYLQLPAYISLVEMKTPKALFFKK